MGQEVPRFQINLDAVLAKARRLAKRNVAGITINLPFISFSVRPDELEEKVAREVVIRLADKRVLNAFECCDACVARATRSLQEIRGILIDKKVELSDRPESTLYLLLDAMLEGVRQFLTFDERIQALDNQPPLINRMSHREAYFVALRLLRPHLYRCLVQVAAIARMEIPGISPNMRYDSPWELSSYVQVDE